MMSDDILSTLGSPDDTVATATREFETEVERAIEEAAGDTAKLARWIALKIRDAEMAAGCEYCT